MTSSPRPRRTPTVHAVGLPDLIGAALVKPGEELVSTLRAWPAMASLNADGSVNFDGRSYATPSAAAVAVREGRATNGWSMWGVHRRGEVVRLAAIRAEFEAAHSVSSALGPAGESAAPVLPEEEDVDPNAPDPADVQPTPAPAEDSTEDPGLVTSFGMFWRRDQVDWSKGNRSRILGHQAGNEKEINFAGLIGVYLLHDGARTVYVGRVSKPRMGLRLFEHTKDRLSGRWDRFSWFGLRPVLSKGALGDPGATFGTDLVVATMEAI